MKVLSLTEPYATLIKKGIKCIETRSWKTKYRGCLFIHASSTKPNYNGKSNDFKNIISNMNLNFGYIICKCNLVDCIYMTEEYIKNIKNNNYIEYICGEYEVGRYAWILENIEILDSPIKAKGHLNIWEYNNK